MRSATVDMVEGAVEAGWEPVADAFRTNFASGTEVGAACAVYHRGDKVVDLWGGFRDPATAARWNEDTLVLVFSTTKGMSSLAVAVAHSQGLFSYDERVATYWPEFSQGGKADVTVRQLFSHQAGLCAIDEPMDLELLGDPEIYDDDELPSLRMRETALVDQFIKIPPRDGNHKEVAYFNFPQDAILHTAVVHAHYRGTYSKLELQTPDGKRETVLNVPFYDFNWQRMYEFEEPLDIPAGSKLIATYVYDNSARNPANPDPDKEITWGDQSFEEMFYTSLRYRWKDETVENPVNYTEQMLQSRLIGMMDDNLDDKIQVEELRGPFERLAPQFALGDANKDGGIDAQEFVPILKMLQNGSRRQAPAEEGAAGGE